MGVFAGNTNSWWNLTGGTDSSRTYIATNKVVQSGLVLNLDAGASTSYPGSGTTWTDLSDKISSATGALPIYNTTGTYGAVKGSGTRTDAFASSLVLAIPMDGANNGTTFTDESATIRGSGSGKTITRFGDTKTLTAQSKYYGSSGFFDGTGDYLSCASSVDFELGNGSFTLEAFVYANSWSTTNGGAGLVGKGGVTSLGGDVYTIQFPSGVPHFYVFASSQSYFAPIVNSNTTLSVNTWYHIAVTRDGNNTRIFIDGVLKATSTENYTITSGGSLYVGTQPYNPGESARSHNGYIQDFRIYKGVAKYTANFTPPGNPNNGTLTNGPTYSSVSGGSLVFDGTNDYVNIGTQSLVGSGTSPFSVELWFYNTKNWTSGQYSVFNTIKQDTEFFIAVFNSSGTLYLYSPFRGGTAQWGIPVTQSNYVNKWVCLSIVYNGGDKNTASSFDTYSNGVKLPTGSVNLGGAGGATNSNRISPDEGGIYYQGNIGAYKIYNRALTASEIQQNYNALRSRFGI